VSNAVFPTLAGLTWNVLKSPRWSSKVQQSVGGKEMRAAYWTTPIYTWQLTYELLRSSALLELQSLIGFFNARQGRFDSFLYSDPSDNNVTAHGFGAGDGVKTAFQLQRTIAGPRTDIYGTWPVYTVPRKNSALWSRDLTNAVWVKTGSVGFALNAIGLDGSTSGTTLTDASATLFGAVTQTVTIPNDGASHTVSFWIGKDSNQARFVGMDAILNGGSSVTRNLNLNTQTGAIGNYSAPVGVGAVRVVDEILWWVVEVVLTNNTTGNFQLNTVVYPSVGTVFGTPSAAAQGSCVVGQVQVELNATAFTSPIFTTSAAVTVLPSYYPAAGDAFEPVLDLALPNPQIFVNGVLNIAYTQSATGVITFTVPPAAGAALTWTGFYYWRVRFNDDVAEFNNFLYQLWEAKQITLVSVK
jgi:hypothetical protein